jgi:hypothetical protein
VRTSAERSFGRVQARELEGGDDLRAVVVERRGRVRDQEAQLLEAGGIAAPEVRLQPVKGGGGALAPSAHLAEADEAVVRLDLDDRADEASPVAAVRVAKRRLERDGDRRRPDIGYSHGAAACEERGLYPRGARTKGTGPAPRWSVGPSLSRFA